MNLNRKAKQVLNWTPGRKKGQRKTEDKLAETIRGHLRIGLLELTWEDALDVAEDRDGWRKRIARCAAQHGTD